MPTLLDLEAEIGLPSGSESTYDIKTLEAKIKANLSVQLNVRYWLEKQGIPEGKIRSAKHETLAKAYCASRYLRAWRNAVNPNWRLLGGNDSDASLLDDDTPDAAILDGAPPTQEPAPNAAPPPAQNSAQTEAWLKSLFAQINTTVEKLVTDKLNKTSLRLDDNAKAQIRTLAAQAAQDRIDELAPPRRLEVHDTSRETTVDLGLQHEKFPTLLRAVQARDHRGFKLNVWLTGPTGSGKTSAAEAVAKALALPFGSDGSLDADYKVLGFRDANGNVISTQFLNIYENGGIYVADEIDNWLPSALLSLNAALANGWCSSPRGLIKRHPDACVIACANTWGLGATGDYVGRTRLDAASLDRFQPKISWPIDERLEAAVADQMGGTDGLVWHSIVKQARRAASTQGLKIIISPRATFAGIALLAAGFTQAEVVEMTIASGLSPEQAKNIGLDAIKAPKAHSTHAGEFVR